MNSELVVSVRRTAIFCLIGFAVLVAAGLLERGRLRAVVALAVPAIVAAAPLIFIVWRLSRGPDISGLLTAILYPAAVFLILAYEAWLMAHGTSAQKQDLLAMVFFFFASPVLVVCVVLLGGLGLLLVRGAMALTSHGSAPGPLAFGSVAAVLIVWFVLAWRPAIG